jgi:hypothetical protein
MKKDPDQNSADSAEIEALITRIERGQLRDGDAQLLARLLRLLLRLITLLQQKNASLSRLKRLLFGPRSDKRREANSSPGSGAEGETGSESSTSTENSSPDTPKGSRSQSPTRKGGHRYIRSVLEQTFGSQELERLHRLTEGGPAPASLTEELSEIESLFLGAHVCVSRELGLAPDTSMGSNTSTSEAAERFVTWRRELNSDPDLNLDLRAMVPVFYDVARRKLKVWAFLGWSRRPITVSFARPPKATIRGLKGRLRLFHPTVRWGALHADLQYPVTAELYVDRILDRDEFRKICDSCGTRSEILRRLDAS